MYVIFSQFVDNSAKCIGYFSVMTYDIGVKFFLMLRSGTSLEVKTPHFHCVVGAGSISGLGTRIPRAAWHG